MCKCTYVFRFLPFHERYLLRSLLSSELTIYNYCALFLRQRKIMIFVNTIGSSFGKHFLRATDIMLSDKKLLTLLSLSNYFLFYRLIFRWGLLINSLKCFLQSSWQISCYRNIHPYVHQFFIVFALCKSQHNVFKDVCKVAAPIQGGINGSCQIMVTFKKLRKFLNYVSYPHILICFSCKNYEYKRKYAS